MSHRYYSPLRPLSLGTFPKPQGNEILHIENFEERQNVPEIARQAWGYIEYKEALTEIEAAAYELIPSNCISENRAVCNTAIACYDKYELYRERKSLRQCYFLFCKPPTIRQQRHKVKRKHTAF